MQLTTEQARLIHRARETLASGDEALATVLRLGAEAPSGREDPPPPPSLPPPDPPPPRDRSRDDPPPPRQLPPPSHSPISRIEPIRPRAGHLEISPEGVRDLNSDKKWPTLRAAIMALKPEKPIVVAVKGSTGTLQFGTKYLAVAEFPLDIAFLAVTQGAKIGPFVHDSKWPALLGLELHGMDDQNPIVYMANNSSFAFHQQQFIKRMILNCWAIKPLSSSPTSQASGWYCTEGWDLFVCKGYKPEGSGQLAGFREHVVYPKHGGMMQFLDNDMRGFGRCFANDRPHQAGTVPYPFGASPRPSGPVLWSGNVSDGAGWDRPTMEGGAVMTCYAGLEFPVVFERNVIKNARMGGIMCGRGAGNTNPYLTADGYSFSQVYLIDNEIHVNGKDGSDPRHAVNLADIPELFFIGKNIFRSDKRLDLALGSAGYNSRSVADVRVIGRESVPDFADGGIWSPTLNKFSNLTPADLIMEIE